MIAVKNRALAFLIQAYEYAAVFIKKENEAIALRAELSEEDPKFKEKQKDAAKYRVAAKIFVKQKADPLIREISGYENKESAADFDMLRNKINNMCMDIFADDPKHWRYS